MVGREEGRSGGLSDGGGLGEGTRAQCMLGVQHRVRHECGRGNTGRYCHWPPPTCGSRVWEHLAHSWDWCRFGGRQGTQRWGVCDAVSPTFPAAWPPQGEAGPVALGGQRGAARSHSPVLAAPLSPVPGALLPPRGGVQWCFPDTRAHSPWAGGTGGSCLVVRWRLGGTAKVGGQKRASWSTFWFHFT